MRVNIFIDAYLSGFAYIFVRNSCIFDGNISETGYSFSVIPFLHVSQYILFMILRPRRLFSAAQFCMDVIPLFLFLILNFLSFTCYCCFSSSGVLYCAQTFSNSFNKWRQVTQCLSTLLLSLSSSPSLYFSPFYFYLPLRPLLPYHTHPPSPHACEGSPARSCMVSMTNIIIINVHLCHRVLVTCVIQLVTAGDSSVISGCNGSGERREMIVM